MLDVLLDAVLDSLKALPFLFGAYLLIEFLEHRSHHHGHDHDHGHQRHHDGPEGEIRQAGILARLGPLGGAALGCVPQCGFSVAAANFYAGRLITPGTLLAVFLATSDEAVPILLSHPRFTPDLLRLIVIKLMAAVIFGFLVDLVWRRARPRGEGEPFEELCKDCNCERDGVVKSALRHTGKVFLFLLVINLALGYAIYFVGEDTISRFLLSGSVLQPLLAALIGFIPNCGASVILTRLYLAGSLSFGALLSGLCTGAGLGLAVLFRANKRLRENLALAALLYAAAVLTGFLCLFLPEVH